MIQTATVRAGLVAILVAIVLSGCDFPPAASPTLSPTLVSPAGGVAPGEVTIDPALPTALPLPDNIWDQAGSGWVLATYRPSVEQWTDAPDGGVDVSIPATRQVVYLVSPEGTRYQVLELSPSRAIILSSWSAGEPRAFVRTCPEGDGVCNRGEGATSVLDLTTGTITPYDAPAGADDVAFALPGAARVWTSRTSAPLPSTGAEGTFLERDGQFVELGEGWTIAGRPSPTMAWLALERWVPQGDGTNTHQFAVASLTTGAVRTLAEVGGLSCGPSGWADDGAMVVRCSGDMDATQRWFEVEPTTGAMTEFVPTIPGEGVASVYHGVWLSPGVWAGPYGFGDPALWDMEATFGIDKHGTPIEIGLADGNGAPLQTVRARGAVGGVLYAEGTHAPVDAQGVATVVTYDPATGRQTVLLPEPPGGPGASQVWGANVHYFGVTSWVVAP